MPFAPELNYFFLYLSTHIERTHGVLCRRADQKFSTKPVRNKISDYIRTADIIIADCTGDNPTVLYELGIAHALEKDVILITQDSMAHMPSDIRLFEFIKYDLGHHDEFLARIDAAIRDLLVARYDRLFEAARQLFEQYKQANPAAQMASKDLFLATVKAAERSEGVPPLGDAFAIAEFILPAIVLNSDDVGVLANIKTWLLQLE